jgi:hypothetical protein
MRDKQEPKGKYKVMKRFHVCCPDCGEIGERRGHYGCQYPTNDPNIEGLEDPMERER